MEMSTDTVGIWLLVTAALVLFMTPGLAFFYGGLVKAKSVVSMMMLSFGALGIVSVLWILYGANLSAGQADDGALIPRLLGPVTPFAQQGVAGADLIDVAFGATFAIITVALVSGAVADRARYFPWLLFAGVWGTLSYFPIAGWVWGDGWIGGFHEITSFPEVLDWAGGTAVHINAGAAALGLAVVLGRRKVGFSKAEFKPHNVPLVLIGAAILWFGWFGFNTGAADNLDDAGLIFLNTIAAPAAGILGYIVVEHFKDGKATAVGAASGVIAGLVAITPACAFLDPIWAIVLGLLAGVICAYAIDLKWKLGYDDSLDVVGLHLVAGLLGTIYLGFFAQEVGLFTGGGFGQVVSQVVPSVAVMVYSFAVAYAVGMVIEKTIGFRVTEEEELAGVDTALHGADGYSFD